METMEKSEMKEMAATVNVMPIPAGSHAHEILRHAVVSEKAAIGEAQGVFTFIVSRDANKTQVKEAVATLYGIRPVAVRMVNRDGKTMIRGRVIGRTQGSKRAMVKLPKGKTLSLHQGV